MSCNEKVLKEKLPKDLELYHDRVNRLQTQLSENFDPDELHNEVYKLENEIKVPASTRTSRLNWGPTAGLQTRPPASGARQADGR